MKTTLFGHILQYNQMLLLCTSIQMFASKTCPIHEAPNRWISTSLLFNSYSWWKQEYLALFCNTGNASFMYKYTIVCIEDSPHQWSSTLMNLHLTAIQLLYLMKTALFGFILQYRKCSFYVLVYKCQNSRFSPLAKLHINESVPIQLLYLMKTAVFGLNLQYR
jgi:hypothetical protein